MLYLLIWYICTIGFNCAEMLTFILRRFDKKNKKNKKNFSTDDKLLNAKQTAQG